MSRSFTRKSGRSHRSLEHSQEINLRETLSSICSSQKKDKERKGGREKKETKTEAILLLLIIKHSCGRDKMPIRKKITKSIVCLCN